jgi:uncharacterized protein YkwD
MKKLLMVAVLALGIGIGLFWYNSKTSEEVAKPPVVASDEASRVPTVEELLRLTNEERAKVGVKPLLLEPLLNKSAQMKADEMHVNDNFNHVSSSGKRGLTYIVDSGVECQWYAENLGSGYNSSGIIASWMNSPGHRDALLNSRYDQAGFGIVEHYKGWHGGKSLYYVALHFCDKN